MNTAGRVGKQRFLCQWSDRAERVWAAEVQVELMNREQFEPAAISVGIVLPGEKFERTANLIQTWPIDAKAPPPLGVIVSDKSVVATLGPSEEGRVGSKLIRRITPVTIVVAIQETAGYDVLHLRSSAEPNAILPTAHLSIDWRVRPTVVATPTRVVLRKDELERTVRVESPEGKKLTVVECRCSHPAVTVTKVADHPDRVLIRWEPTKQAESPLAEVTIQTDAATHSRVVVPVVLPVHTTSNR